MIREITLPDFSDCLVNVSNSILKYCGVPAFHLSQRELDKYLSKEYKNVVLFLYDGLGDNFLYQHFKNSFLTKNRVKSISSVFPATTTAATTSVLTGLFPVEHCWLGWDIYVSSLDKTVTMYRNVEKGKIAQLSDTNICLKEFPYTTIIDRINKTSDINAYSVSPYLDIHYDENDIDMMFETVASLCDLAQRNFIYAYCIQPDISMHLGGVGCKDAIKQVDTLNKKTEALCKNLKDSLVIVTADHGLFDVKDYIFLSDYPKLTDMLVRETSLESRATNFFVKEGYKDDFIKEFNNLLGNDFLLFTKEQVTADKLFGEGKPHSKFTSCLGDYLAVSISNKAIVDKRQKHPLKALHAGFTKDEVMVPLIIIDC